MQVAFVTANSAAKIFFGSQRVGFGDNDYPGSNQDGSVTGVQSDENDTVLPVSGGYRFRYRFMGAHHEVGDFGYSVNSASAEIVYLFP